MKKLSDHELILKKFDKFKEEKIIKKTVNQGLLNYLTDFGEFSKEEFEEGIIKLIFEESFLVGRLMKLCSKFDPHQISNYSSLKRANFTNYPEYFEVSVAGYNSGYESV